MQQRNLDEAKFAKLAHRTLNLKLQTRCEMKNYKFRED